jgi:hypothetical protein
LARLLLGNWRRCGDAMNRLQIVPILLIFAAPVYAQDQQTDLAKLKVDAQKVVSIIKGDEAKTQTFCQMGILGNQVDEAIQKQDTKKAYELTQKLTELEKDLGSEYLGLFESLRSLLSPMVLTGSPCRNFPRPRPAEGPKPSAGITWALQVCR